ncbi:MAG: hypothetical protein EZS28_037076 [Streblomastix strix]|uniref:Uncharacterized protein n=1 Tax=Streblomastix strix TaxID=222440 RepID=A0A5J4UAF2_9EUKA|nr:MAG: hypothetical protein EZS28_037076 [Streblomastix strix]
MILLGDSPKVRYCQLVKDKRGLRLRARLHQANIIALLRDSGYWVQILGYDDSYQVNGRNQGRLCSGIL